MSWLKDALFGKKPSVKQVDMSDPYQTAVSSPLSAYLAKSIGQGSEPFKRTDELYDSRYKDLMTLDPNSYFNKYVQEPQTAAFKEDALPLITESWAGGLRGSGRFRTQEDAINKFQQGLASTRADFVQKTADQQMTAGNNRELVDYKSWTDSLPENNPILQRAIEFLHAPSGYNVGTYTDQGQEGTSASDLGGLFKTVKPILSKIPLIGNLFSFL